MISEEQAEFRCRVAKGKELHKGGNEIRRMKAEKNSIYNE